MRMMEEAVEDGGDGRGVVQMVAPAVDGPVLREERRGAFAAAHDDLQEVLGSGVRELPHAELVDDEQRHACVVGEEGVPVDSLMRDRT